MTDRFDQKLLTMAFDIEGKKAKKFYQNKSPKLLYFVQRPQYYTKEILLKTGIE